MLVSVQYIDSIIHDATIKIPNQTTVLFAFVRSDSFSSAEILKRLLEPPCGLM